MDIVGSSLISVPTGTVDRVIEKITGKGFPAEEVSSSERKKILNFVENPDPNYAMIRVWHGVLPIEEVMGDILKRVI